MIRTSITRALMASFAIFAQFSKLWKSATDVFVQNKLTKEIFNSEILISIRLISNWTSCRIIQGVIVVVISNRNLKLLARLLTELYSTLITSDVNSSRSAKKCVLNVARKFRSYSDRYSKLTKSTKVDLRLPSSLMLQHVRAMN